MPTSLLINPMRYPTLYMYMVNLPHGLASYPEAQTHGEVAIRVRDRFPNLAIKGDLPAEIVAAIEAPWQPNDWVSEVSFMTLAALVRDVIFRDDEKYLQFCYDSAKETFSSNLMRAVMHFVSPSLLMLGATKKWALIKKGTTLKVIKQEKHDMYISLSFPEGLYHKSMLSGFAEGFKAAINCTKAQNTVVVTEFTSRTECRYKGTWTFE